MGKSPSLSSFSLPIQKSNTNQYYIFSILLPYMRPVRMEEIYILEELVCIFFFLLVLSAQYFYLKLHEFTPLCKFSVV